MAQKTKSEGRGWHHDSTGHAKAGEQGGKKTAQKYGVEFYREIGKKGGEKSTGKFKKNDPRAKEAGRKGGQARAENK